MDFKLKKTLSDDLGNDLLADVNVNNLMAQAVSSLAKDINQKRLEIIAKKLKEVIGIELNIEEEERRRFKRLAIEYTGNQETIYFNDGSDEGKRIVTFVKVEQPMSFDANKCEMSVEYSYY